MPNISTDLQMTPNNQTTAGTANNETFERTSPGTLETRQLDLASVA
jgi:hypothetical protein